MWELTFWEVDILRDDILGIDILGVHILRLTQLYALASLPSTQGTSVYTQASASYSTYKIRLAITSRQLKVQLV